jgi:glycerophosphoryl diester phosphodiesterase
MHGEADRVRVGALLSSSVLCAAALVVATPVEALSGRCTALVGYAHQGVPIKGTYSHNSMGAFRNAASIGMDGVETDVQPTADGDLVMFHDRTLDRLTSGTGYVQDSSTAYVRSLKLRDGSSRVPLYSEFLDFLQANPGRRAIIEIKSSAVWTRALYRDRLIAPIIERNLLDKVVFDDPFVKRIATQIETPYPQVQTAAKGLNEMSPDQLMAMVDDLVVNRWKIDKAYADRIKALGGDVYLGGGVQSAWQSALDWKVRGVVTEEPSGLIGWCG